MMHIQSPYFIAILLSLALMQTQLGTAYADFILQFEGKLYDEFVPSGGGNPFTNADRIVGTITFDNIGDTSAAAFILSTTIGGAPGFTFNVPDVKNAGLLTISQNEFDWDGGSLPTGFGLTVEGEAFGALDGVESISISDIGDVATIDFGAANEFSAFSMSAGTFTAVPEPSSLALLALGLGCGVLRRKRRSIRS